MTKLPTVFKILAVGDIHFKSDNVEQTEKLRLEISKIIISNSNLEAVVILGDILHKHDKIDLFSLCRSIEFLSSIRKTLDMFSHQDGKKRHLWVLIGNHDRPNNTTFLTEEHPFTALKSWNDTIVADKPILVSPSPNYKFLLMPYVPVGLFEKAINDTFFFENAEEKDETTTTPWYKKEMFKNIKCVFAHQEFKGCKLTQTQTNVSQNGDIYPIEAPLCVSGHIHDFGSPQPNIVYVGTPFHHGWMNLDGSLLVKNLFKNDTHNNDDNDECDASSLAVLTSSRQQHHREKTNNNTVSLFTFVLEGDDNNNDNDNKNTIRHLRIKPKNICQNVIIAFESCEDFLDLIRNIKDSSFMNVKCLKRPYTIGILKAFGIVEGTLLDKFLSSRSNNSGSSGCSFPSSSSSKGDDESHIVEKYISKIKIKVKCQNKEQFINNILNSQARTDLALEGISVSSEIVSTRSLYGSPSDSIKTGEEAVEATSSTSSENFIEKVIEPFLKTLVSSGGSTEETTDDDGFCKSEKSGNNNEITANEKKFFMDTFPEIKMLLNE